MRRECPQYVIDSTASAVVEMHGDKPRMYMDDRVHLESRN